MEKFRLKIFAVFFFVFLCLDEGEVEQSLQVREIGLTKRQYCFGVFILLGF